eukprot:7035244-Lingulodinium_polyedra.AAC.1
MEHLPKPQGESKPPAKRQRKALTGQQTQERSYHWGPGLLTWKPASQSWQATCPRCNGSHRNLVNPRTICRQTRAVKRDGGRSGTMDDELTQRALRHWINSCRNFPTRIAHQKYHPAADDLPSAEEVAAA